MNKPAYPCGTGAKKISFETFTVRHSCDNTKMILK